MFDRILNTSLHSANCSPCVASSKWKKFYMYFGIWSCDFHLIYTSAATAIIYSDTFVTFPWLNLTFGCIMVINEGKAFMFTKHFLWMNQMGSLHIQCIPLKKFVLWFQNLIKSVAKTNTCLQACQSSKILPSYRTVFQQLLSVNTFSHKFH